MKRALLLFISLIGILSTEGQVLIQLQLPSTGLTLKSQLWAFSLVNTGSSTLTAQVEMDMTDVSNNAEVLSATTKTFQLPTGIKQLQTSDIEPIAYNVSNPAYNLDASSSGFLPVGTFSVCYTVLAIGPEGSQKMGQDCEQIQVEPLGPPVLVSPPDSESVEMSNPVFIWMPPVPNTLFSSLQYNLYVVEIEPTQSPADAIQQNVPLLLQQNISFTELQYPLSAPALDTSKSYAWQIVAMNGTTPVASSDVWSFQIVGPALDTVYTFNNPPIYYVILSRNDHSGFSLCQGILRFAYQSEINDPTVQLNLLDISSSKQATISLDSTSYSVQYGQNLLQLDLRNTPGMINNHIYLLQLINPRNESWYMRFQYIALLN